jgi:hypothetical protein
VTPAAAWLWHFIGLPSTAGRHQVVSRNLITDTKSRPDTSRSIGPRLTRCWYAQAPMRWFQCAITASITARS